MSLVADSQLGLLLTFYLWFRGTGTSPAIIPKEACSLGARVKEKLGYGMTTTKTFHRNLYFRPVGCVLPRPGGADRMCKRSRGRCLIRFSRGFRLSRVRFLWGIGHKMKSVIWNKSNEKTQWQRTSRLARVKKRMRRRGRKWVS